MRTPPPPTHTQEYAVTRDHLTHFLTYADNNAVGYFSKQGFTKEITLAKDRCVRMCVCVCVCVGWVWVRTQDDISRRMHRVCRVLHGQVERDMTVALTHCCSYVGCTHTQSHMHDHVCDAPPVPPYTHAHACTTHTYAHTHTVTHTHTHTHTHTGGTRSSITVMEEPS